MDKKNLYLVAGARRGIGKTFANYFRSKNDGDVMGFSRKQIGLCKQLDFLNVENVENLVGGINFNKFEKIVYLHSIGIDKFEPEGKPQIDLDKDGIDDEVYGTNVVAFRNLADLLVKQSKEKDLALTLINIGSISDIFDVPYWQSFTRSKNIVRQYMKANSSDRINGLMLNISSTLDVDAEVYARKFANTTYWQTESELLNKVKPLFEINLNSNYAEFDFFKHNPNFKSDYFTNLPELLKTWKKDMGYEGKEIPLGLRI